MTRSGLNCSDPAPDTQALDPRVLQSEEFMSPSVIRAVIVVIVLFTSTSCAALRAVQRTPAAIESNTGVLRGVERSITELTPALQRVAVLEGPLTEVSNLDSTLARVAGLQSSLVGVADLGSVLQRVAALQQPLVDVGGLRPSLERTSALGPQLARVAALAGSLENVAELRAVLDSVARLRETLASVAALREPLESLGRLEPPLTSLAGAARLLDHPIRIVIGGIVALLAWGVVTFVAVRLAIGGALARVVPRTP